MFSGLCTLSSTAGVIRDMLPHQSSLLPISALSDEDFTVIINNVYYMSRFFILCVFLFVVCFV